MDPGTKHLTCLPLALLAAALLCLSAAPALAQDDPPPLADPEEAPESSILLLFDSSGSMKADDGSGNRRIDTAKGAITGLLEGAPGDAKIGLRVFGGRFGDKDKRRGCTDSRLLFPVENIDADGAKSAIQSYKPTGFTPISLSLRRAAEDLPPTGARTIILVSDGQDTCGPPRPCDVAREVANRGIKLQIQAIGFQVNNKSRRELQCIARAGNGVYRDVQDAPRLAEELRALSVRALRDYRAEGEPVEGGPTVRQATEIGPGQFVDTIGPDEERWYSIELAERETLQAAAALVPRDRTGLETVLADFTLQIVNPRFEEPGTNNSGAAGGSVFADDSEGGVDSIGVVGRPVGVGDQADETAVQSGFGSAGRYYLRVRLTDADDRELLNKLDGERVDLELLVNVLGREGGQAEPPEEDGTVSASQAATTPGGIDDGPGAVVLALVCFAAIAAGIAGALGLTRRRRSA